MAFKMSRMTIMKAIEPEEWRVAMQKAIAKHRGVALRIAQDLDIGISTFKRWVEADTHLTRLMVQVRKAKQAERAVGAVSPRP